MESINPILFAMCLGLGFLALFFTAFIYFNGFATPTTSGAKASVPELRTVRVLGFHQQTSAHSSTPDPDGAPSLDTEWRWRKVVMSTLGPIEVEGEDGVARIEDLFHANERCDFLVKQLSRSGRDFVSSGKWTPVERPIFAPLESQCCIVWRSIAAMSLDTDSFSGLNNVVDLGNTVVKKDQLDGILGELVHRQPPHNLTTCPDCSQNLTVNVNAKGSLIRCPNCGGMFNASVVRTRYDEVIDYLRFFAARVESRGFNNVLALAVNAAKTLPLADKKSILESLKKVAQTCGPVTKHEREVYRQFQQILVEPSPS